MAITNLVSADVKLKKDGVEFGCSRSASVSISAEVKEATCQASGQWRTIATGRKSWTVTLEALVRKFSTPEDEAANVTYKQVLADLVAGTAVDIEFDIAGERQGGSGFFTQVTLDKAEDDFLTYSMTIEGNGEFSFLD